MILLIIPLIITVISAFTESYYDARKSLRGKTIHHGLSALIRVVVAWAMAIYVIDHSMLILEYSYFVMLLQKMLYAAMLLVLYWIIFDPNFNRVKHGLQKMWIVNPSSVTDRLAMKLVDQDGQLYAVLKFTIFNALLLVLYLLNWV